MHEQQVIKERSGAGSADDRSRDPGGARRIRVTRHLLQMAPNRQGTPLLHPPQRRAALHGGRLHRMAQRATGSGSMTTTFKVRFWEIADWAKSKDKKKKKGRPYGV